MRLRCKIPSCRWCRCTSRRNKGSATSAIARVEHKRLTTTVALSSLMIVQWWWWFPMRVFSRTRDVPPESNPEEDPKSNLHSTLQCSRRTRVVQARSSDSTSLNKPQDLLSETSLILTLEPLPPSDANWYARCLHLSKAWVSIATTSRVLVFPKQLSISVSKTVQSRTCTRG